MMTRRNIKARASIRIECEPEHIPVRGNASAIDPTTDRDIANAIIADLERGNTWAWCTVRVIASLNGHEGSDVLGACSYKDEKAFIRGGYYRSMVNAAIDDLIARMECCDHCTEDE